jgi:hypothetical protein
VVKKILKVNNKKTQMHNNLDKNSKEEINLRKGKMQLLKPRHLHPKVSLLKERMELSRLIRFNLSVTDPINAVDVKLKEDNIEKNLVNLLQGVESK